MREAWHAKETLRDVYDIPDHETGAETVRQLTPDLQDESIPEKVNKLGRTLWRWREQISN